MPNTVNEQLPRSVTGGQLTTMLNSPEIRIAVIDDDEDDYLIIKDYINEIEGARFTIDWYYDYNKAIEQIKARAYNLYFVDYRLGNQTGLDLLIETYAFGYDDPIVLLTGMGNKSIDIKAMEYGATDYLIKSDLNTEKLERCIRYSLDRADALREVKAREDKYRNLFKSSKDAVFIADKNLAFIEMNQAATRLLGCRTEDAPSCNLFDFVKDGAQKKLILELIAAGHSIKDLEVQVENTENETRSCLFSISFQEISNGQNLLHGILHDITHIKKAEMVNLQAQKLAANERLVRTLAHEIRNPLNNISLSAENLQVSDEGDEQQRSLLGIVKRNCNRINQIITELLNLTKPLGLVFEQSTLQDILDESINMASDRINLQKITVEKNYPATPIEINADKAKLIIAFTNILINATEAMQNKPDGKLVVSLASDGETNMVLIRDNGTGIPEEYLSKLFEPFFTMKKNGMGLGLAASYSIIQSHKGTIDVDTAVNKGTTFIIGFKKQESL